nr:MAG TPA: hypothetical protein [Bacteriophage sp.]
MQTFFFNLSSNISQKLVIAMVSASKIFLK